MIIAIATENGMVAQHFGRCPQYTLVTLEDGKETGRQVVDNPGHEPGFLPKFLHEHGANAVLAGGMGPMALNLFNERGIQPYVGISGSIEDAIQGFLKGTLKDGESTCHH